MEWENERQRSTASSSADSPSQIILSHQINSISPNNSTSNQIDSTSPDNSTSPNQLYLTKSILPHKINFTSTNWTPADFHPLSLTYNPVTSRCSFYFFRYNKYNWFYFFRYNKSGRFYFCRFHRFLTLLCCVLSRVCSLGQHSTSSGAFIRCDRKISCIQDLEIFKQDIVLERRRPYDSGLPVRTHRKMRWGWEEEKNN